MQGTVENNKGSIVAYWTDDDEVKGPKPKFTQIEVIAQDAEMQQIVKANLDEVVNIYKSILAFRNKTDHEISKIEIVSTESGRKVANFFLNAII